MGIEMNFLLCKGLLLSWIIERLFILVIFGGMIWILLFEKLVCCNFLRFVKLLGIFEILFLFMVSVKRLVYVVIFGRFCKWFMESDRVCIMGRLMDDFSLIICSNWFEEIFSVCRCGRFLMGFLIKVLWSLFFCIKSFVMGSFVSVLKGSDLKLFLFRLMICSCVIFLILVGRVDILLLWRFKILSLVRFVNEVGSGLNSRLFVSLRLCKDGICEMVFRLLFVRWLED